MPTVVRRSIIAALLVIVLAAFYGVTRLPGAPSEPTTAIIRSLYPEPNGQIPQQGQLKIELETGWTGSLQIDQRDIPASQLNDQQKSKGSDEPKMATSRETLVFQPGPGKALEYFVGGQNCAVLTYWQRVAGPSQSFKKSWCFTAV